MNLNIPLYRDSNNCIQFTYKVIMAGHPVYGADYEVDSALNLVKTMVTLDDEKCQRLRDALVQGLDAEINVNNLGTPESKIYILVGIEN